MELLTPGLGLIFWQTVVFLVLFWLLRRYAWKPILGGLRAREQEIGESLGSAERARAQLASLEQESNRVLAESMAKRDLLLKEAKEAGILVEQAARDRASGLAEGLLEEARTRITQEEQAARKRLQDEVVGLSLLLAERILQGQLADKAEAESLSKRYLDSIVS